MLLAIDIGNSSVSIGLFSGDSLTGCLKIAARPAKPIDFYSKKINNLLSERHVEKPLDGVIISSVVSELTGLLKDSVNVLSSKEPVTVNASLLSGLNFDIQAPEEVGSDRIANVIAAMHIYGAPVLVVDFGTATTLSAARDKSFIGGAILPGLELMGKSLQRGTSRLPYVDINCLRDQEYRTQAVGKDTNKGIISGIIYGTAGGVERTIEEMEKEEKCRFKVAITGGYSGIMTRYLRREHSVDPDLTLKGLNLIHKRYV